MSLGQTKIIAHHHHHRLQISLSPAHIILVQISPNPGNIFTDVDDLVMIMVCKGSEQNLTPHFDRLLFSRDSDLTSPNVSLPVRHQYVKL